MADPIRTEDAIAVLLTALQSIVLETMDYPPVRRYSTDSYLPEHLFKQAIAAIEVATGRPVSLPLAPLRAQNTEHAAALLQLLSAPPSMSDSEPRS